jgi:hypothetical protein
MQAAFMGPTHRYPYNPTPDQQLHLLLEVRSESVELPWLTPNVPLNQRSTLRPLWQPLRGSVGHFAVESASARIAQVRDPAPSPL